MSGATEPTWADVPVAIKTQIAIRVLAAFKQSPDAPSGLEDYEVHWVAITHSSAKVQLDKPILRWKDRSPGPVGGSIHKVWSIIEPKWEIKGGAVMKDAPTKQLQMVARIGWDEETGIAVLFFADGGSLNFAKVLHV